MTATDRAYLAGVIDARGTLTTLRHLRITIRQRTLRVILPMLRTLGPGGFALHQRSPRTVMETNGRRYHVGPRRVVCYEFGVKKTGAILDAVAPYLRRDLRRERTRRDLRRERTRRGVRRYRTRPSR